MFPLVLEGLSYGHKNWTEYDEAKEMLFVSDESQRVVAFRFKDE